ncbi:MAG TPA: hypothetical protein VIU85_02340 [Chthoniobacterales bacterium]
MITPFLQSTSRTVALSLTIISLGAFAGCKKSGTATNESSPPSNRPKIDACGLITKDEIEKIQGSPIKDAKGSENSDNSYRIAQCFYTAETFNKSVSLAVTQSNPGSPNAKNPRDFWKQSFGRWSDAAKDKEKEEEEKGDKRKKESLEEHEERESGQPPKKIDGIGDAAYWTANRMGGALYVLKNDVFIRISVGGPESEESKIEHSKALAEKALSRL